MKIVFNILYFFITIAPLLAQTSIKKVIIDRETGSPVFGVQVCKSNNFKTGTITNSDGQFVLKNLCKDDSLRISHISYSTQTLCVNNIISDTIELQKKQYMMEEVVVSTGIGIMHNVIDSLKQNHYVEPVMYDAYIRVLQYQEDHAELHVLSEYVMNIYQNMKSKSEIQVIKTRAKPFSKAGQKYFKDMRMIDAMSINADNIFRFQEDVFNKRKLKKYIITIEDNSQEYIKVRIMHRKDGTSIVLYIDRMSYAVQKMVKYYSQSEQEYKEIGFKNANGKWYLNYSKLIQKTDLFRNDKTGVKTLKQRIVLYNINNNISYNQELFNTAFNLVAKPIEYYLGNWTDNFWEDYHYVPLPEWINERIEEEKAL